MRIPLLTLRAGIVIGWTLRRRMATPRRPLPRGADELRMDTISQLDTIQQRVLALSDAIVKSDWARAQHYGLEIMALSTSAKDKLRAMPGGGS